jgi:hypothetical protein
MDVRNVARQKRWFDAHPERLVRLRHGSLLTVRQARIVHQALFSSESLLCFSHDHLSPHLHLSSC